MPPSVANLKIQRIIVHQIAKRDANGTRNVRYSETLTTLEPIGLATLTERVTSALGRDSHSRQMMIRDDTEGSTLHIAAPLIYRPDAAFVDGSKLLARKLADSQGSRQIPGGVVVIFTGTTGDSSNPMLGVIKAETHSGFAQDASTTTVSLRFLTDLLLTPQQKLYKIGLLVDLRPQEERSQSPSANEFNALVYDHHMAQNSTQNAAIYFYDGFLGCAVMKNAPQLTRDFYEETRTFIDKMPVDDDRKVDLNTALHTYLTTSTRPHVHVREFAEEYFSGDDLLNYQAFMHDQGFPENAVSKDTSTLKNVLKLRRIVFSTNVKIVAPAERFKEIVQIEKPTDEGVTVVRIKGTITNQA